MSTTQKRLELSTSAVTGRRSNQLSHQAKNSFYSEGHTLKTEYRSSYLPSTSFNLHSWSSFRPISTCQLCTSLCLHPRPIYLILSKGPYIGYLILKGASRLDAFSVYPFPAWLPGHRVGNPNRCTSGQSIPVLSY